MQQINKVKNAKSMKHLHKTWTWMSTSPKETIFKQCRKFLFILCLTLLTMSTLFTSCKKDKDDDDNLAASSWFDGTINAQVANATIYTETIKRVSPIIRTPEGLKLFNSGVYRNGGFTIDLSTPDTNDFYLVEPILNSSQPGSIVNSAIIISDKNAKITAFNSLCAFASDTGNLVLDEEIGNLFFYGRNKRAEFWYTDKDFTVKGRKEEIEFGGYHRIENFNLNLKAGWNVVYRERVDKEYGEIFTITTEFVSGLEWYCFPRG
jgi:hypothetical protein